jgi:hypothetical protein
MKSIKVLDSLSIGASVAKNEDILNSVENKHWVLDGIPCIGGSVLYLNKTDAEWYAHELNQYISKGHGDLNYSVNEANIKSREDFNVLLKKRKIDKHLYPSASFAGIEQVEDKINIITYGSAKCCVLDKDFKVKFETLSTTIDELDSKILEELKFLKERHPELPHKKLIDLLIPNLIRNRNKYNTPFGYQVISPFCFSKGEENQINIEDGDYIFLYTAGLEYYWKIFKSKSLVETVKNIINVGLSKVLEELRDIESKDPDCIKYPRFLKSEDASAILMKY